MPEFVRDRRSGGLTGDATGFYAATREFMAGWARMPRPLLGLLVVLGLAAAAALVAGWRRRPGLRPWLVPAGLCFFGLLVCFDVHWMEPSGAAGFGGAPGGGVGAPP